MDLTGIEDVNDIDSKSENKKFSSIYNFVKSKYNDGIIYKYVFIDVNSIFLFPHLKRKYNINSEEIPFKILGNILNIYRMLGSPYKTKFILSIDNGISNILKTINEYKENRPHSIKKEIREFSKTSNNLFNRIIANIVDLLSPIGCAVDILKGETDFKIGYFIQNIIKEDQNVNILVISSDTDYIGMAEYSDVLLKRKDFFLYIKKGDPKLSYIVDKSLNLFSPLQYYFFKSLIGDPIDNIKRLISNKKAIKIINEYNRIYSEDKIYDFKNFLKFCENFVDTSILSKNIYTCFPFNADIFDNDEERVMLELFLKEIVSNKQHNIKFLIEKLGIFRYGGKEFITGFIKKLGEIYGSK